MPVASLAVAWSARLVPGASRAPLDGQVIATAGGPAVAAGKTCTTCVTVAELPLRSAATIWSGRSLGLATAGAATVQANGGAVRVALCSPNEIVTVARSSSVTVALIP